MLLELLPGGVVLDKAAVVAPSDGSVVADDRAQIIRSHFRLAVLV